jgi:hypothetical protein
MPDSSVAHCVGSSDERPRDYRTANREEETTMTKTRRGVEEEVDGQISLLVRLMVAAWRRGVHVAWTVGGQVVVGGPNTLAARAAMDALRPYAELLRTTGLHALADNGIPPMESVDAAKDYVRLAIARDREGGLPGFLEMLGIALPAVDSADSDLKRGS